MHKSVEAFMHTPKGPVTMDLLYACPCVFWGPLDVGAWVVGTCIIQHVRTKTNGGAHIIGFVVQTRAKCKFFFYRFF